MSNDSQAPPSYDSNKPNCDKEGESTTPCGAILLRGATKSQFNGGTINNVAGQMYTNAPENGATPSGGSAASEMRSSGAGKSNSNKRAKPIARSASMLEKASGLTFTDVTFNNIGGDLTSYAQNGNEGEGSAT